MLRYLRMTWIVVRFSLNVRASFADFVELHALCTLVVARAQTPTGPMLLGQARAKVRRMRIARALSRARREAPRGWYTPPPHVA
ncbi:hypothetical protein J2X65_003509 [Ancylobacter sp. 3268]|uniref:hypothetical protein n=1 Tax=Ancylobacter sp. 3268 TaxID=2817752 RepID=UPI00285F53F8|nr:hypothetical protein [Ancylobacter sp. 3268]MDR6954141.1 hypothetical protein [Ancylobacter sp. 3268]